MCVYVCKYPTSLLCLILIPPAMLHTGSIHLCFLKKFNKHLNNFFSLSCSCFKELKCDYSPSCWRAKFEYVALTKRQKSSKRVNLSRKDKREPDGIRQHWILGLFRFSVQFHFRSLFSLWLKVTEGQKVPERDPGKCQRAPRQRTQGTLLLTWFARVQQKSFQKS